LESNSATLEELGSMIQRTSESADSSISLVISTETNPTKGRDILSDLKKPFHILLDSQIQATRATIFGVRKKENFLGFR
jgi:hypothetical protein